MTLYYWLYIYSFFVIFLVFIYILSLFVYIFHILDYALGGGQIHLQPQSFCLPAAFCAFPKILSTWLTFDSVIQFLWCWFYHCISFLPTMLVLPFNVLFHSLSYLLIRCFIYISHFFVFLCFYFSSVHSCYPAFNSNSSYISMITCNVNSSTSTGKTTPVVFKKCRTNKSELTNTHTHMWFQIIAEILTGCFL